LPDLPKSARPLLKAYGTCCVDLDALTIDLDTARARGRKREASRARRAMLPLRTQIQTLERRLEELAADTGHDLAQAFARRRLA
jgi:hypothetical protein